MTSLKMILVAGLAGLTMVGCNSANNTTTSTASTPTSSAVVVSSPESSVTNSAPDATSATTPATSTTGDASTPTTVTTGNLASMIQIEGLYSIESALATAQAAAPGTLVSIDYETERGQMVYSIETMDSTGIVTEQEISVVDGTVVKLETDRTPDNDSTVIQTVTVTMEQALQTAFAQSEGSKFKSIELDSSWNSPVYKVDIIDTMGLEKEVVIDAITGEVTGVRNEENGTPSSTAITMSQAEETAKTTTGASTVIYTTLEYDDGRAVYQVLLAGVDGSGYEIKIDAQTGTMVEFDRD